MGETSQGGEDAGDGSHKALLEGKAGVGRGGDEGLELAVVGGEGAVLVADFGVGLRFAGVDGGVRSGLGGGVREEVGGFGGSGDVLCSQLGGGGHVVDEAVNARRHRGDHRFVVIDQAIDSGRCGDGDVVGHRLPVDQSVGRVGQPLGGFAAGLIDEGSGRVDGEIGHRVRDRGLIGVAGEGGFVETFEAVGDR